jgi:hypothetical protein
MVGVQLNFLAFGLDGTVPTAIRFLHVQDAILYYVHTKFPISYLHIMRNRNYGTKAREMLHTTQPTVMRLAVCR